MMAGRLVVVTILAGLVILAGCGAKKEGVAELEGENLQLGRELRQAKETVAAQQDALREKDEQISNLLKLDPGQRLEALFVVDKIKLGRYTGGTNPDKKDGDDGVRVYVIPQDQAGRTVTAAGSVEIDVFDPEQKEDSLVMSYSFTAAQAKEHWQGGGLANHYSFVCPWKERRPIGNEITVHVKFVDYLTGRSFTANKQCKVQIGGAGE